MDDRGIVIFMVDEKMSPAVGKQLLKVNNNHVLFYFLNARHRIQLAASVGLPTPRHI